MAEQKQPIANEMDYLVALAQKQTNLAREAVQKSRRGNDYWQEKAAAKLLAFCEQEEKLFSLYAETKLYHPKLAELMEKDRPYLQSIADHAKSGWQNLSTPNQE